MKEKKQATLNVVANERIRSERVQLITFEGNNIGIVDRDTAVRMAREANLDLVVLVDKGDDIPVVKIMDLGKALYEKKKKQVESKKHQKVVHVKEIKISPKIGEHDYQTKINQAIQFLKSGKRLKVTLFFRGRENINKDERGFELFDRIDKSFQEQGILDSLVQEKDAKAGQMWTRLYYMK